MHFLFNSKWACDKLFALVDEFGGGDMYLEVPFEGGNKLNTQVCIWFILVQNWYRLVAQVDIMRGNKCFEVGRIYFLFVRATNDGTFGYA